MEDFVLKYSTLVEYTGNEQEVTIPIGIERITQGFRRCDMTETIYIPDSVREIYSGAFYDCSNLKSIIVDENNNTFCSIDGVLFSKDKTEIICCPQGRKGSYTIPEGVKKIHSSAFCRCNGLTSIVLPMSLRNIGASAFSGIHSVQELILPSSVETIEQFAFSGWDSITTVFIPANVKKLGEYGYDAIRGKKLSSIDVDKKNKKYSSIDGMLLTGNGNTIRYCPENKEGMVNLPETVTTINDNAFMGCEKLTVISLPNSLTKIKYGAFNGCKSITEIRIPHGTVEIADDAFEGCSNLVNVHLEEGVSKIGKEAFKNCASLKKIILPKTVMKVEKDAFDENVVIVAFPEIFKKLSNASKEKASVAYLEDKTDFEGEPGSVIVQYILENQKKLLKKVIIEGNVKALVELNTSAPISKKEIQSARKVAIGNGVEQIVEALDIMQDALIKDVSVTENTGNRESHATSNKSVIRNREEWKAPKTGTHLIGKYLGTSEEVLFPKTYNGEDIIGIADAAGVVPEGYEKIKKVVIPEGYTSIGKKAFLGCVSLEHIQFPSTLRTIGEKAFAGCSSLKSVVFPPGVTSLGKNVFEGCELDTIELPSGLKILPKKCFFGAFVNTIIYKGENLVGEGDVFEFWKEPNAFYTDAKVKIKGVTKRALRSLKDFECKEVRKEKTANEIKKEWAFTELQDGTLRLDDYKGIDTDITFPSHIAGKEVTEIGSGVLDAGVGPTAFKRKVSALQQDVRLHITRIKIPNTIRTIGEEAFCDSGTKIVEISDGVSKIGSEAFSNCKRLQSIIWPASLKVIGKGAFSGIHTIDIWNLPEGLEIIEDNAFLYSSIRELHIPESVSFIGKNIVSRGSKIIIYGKPGSEAERMAKELELAFVTE